MTDDLFTNLPIVKSPRLLWMDRNDIAVTHAVSSTGQAWLATCKRIGYTTQSFMSRESEQDALVGLARKLNLKLWNQ